MIFSLFLQRAFCSAAVSMQRVPRLSWRLFGLFSGAHLPNVALLRHLPARSTPVFTGTGAYYATGA